MNLLESSRTERNDDILSPIGEIPPASATVGDHVEWNDYDSG